MICPHDWRPMTVAFDECAICGAIRTAAPTPYVHLQSGDIIVPNVHGQPVLWQPITENESHD